MPVSLRLPPELAERIAKLVDETDTNAHAFMVAAIKEKLEAEELQLEFRAEAERRLEGMKKSGKAIPADEVFDYLRARVRGEKTKRPKARRLS